MGRVTAVDTNPTTDNPENRPPRHEPVQGDFAQMAGKSESSGPSTTYSGSNNSDSGEGRNEPRQGAGESQQQPLGQKRGRYFRGRRRPIRGRRFGGTREGNESRDPNEPRDPSNENSQENQTNIPEGNEPISAEAQEPAPTTVNKQRTDESPDVASWREDAEQIIKERRARALMEAGEATPEIPQAESSSDLPAAAAETAPVEGQGPTIEPPTTLPAEQPPREGGNRFQRQDRPPREQRQGPGRQENREHRQQGPNQQRDRDRDRNKDRDRDRDRGNERDRDRERGRDNDRGERQGQRREEREGKDWNSYQFHHPGLQELKSHVDRIRSNLETVVRDLDKLVETLAKAEQASEIDEDEIEILRQQIKKIQR